MELNDYLRLPYTITLRIDDDGDWIARIQELPGCTADGATQADALADLEHAKREWIQAALEDEVPIPLPESEESLPSGKWVQRVPRSLHKNLVRLAKLERSSLNHLVTSILSEHVGARKTVPSTTTTVQAVAVGYGIGPPLAWVMATKAVGTTSGPNLITGREISRMNDRAEQTQ